MPLGVGVLFNDRLIWALKKSFLRNGMSLLL